MGMFMDVKSYEAVINKAMESERYEEAIGYCDKILEMEPRNWQAMFSKAIAIGFLATPENSMGGLQGKDSTLVGSLTWFQKAQLTFLEDFDKMLSSGKEPGPDFIMWNSADYQVSLRMVIDNFECKILEHSLRPSRASMRGEFLAMSELIPFYAVLLSFDPNCDDDTVKEKLRDDAQHFRNQFSTYFEEIVIKYSLIEDCLPEVRVWLNTLTRAENILKSLNPNYRSILIRINNSTLIELDAVLAANIDGYKSLVSQNSSRGSSNASQGSGCLGVLACVILVVYSLIV